MKACKTRLRSNSRQVTTPGERECDGGTQDQDVILQLEAGRAHALDVGQVVVREARGHRLVLHVDALHRRLVEVGLRAHRLVGARLLPGAVTALLRLSVCNSSPSKPVLWPLSRSFLMLQMESKPQLCA